MYVAVKGGERAIDNAHALLADRRRGDRDVPAISLDQIDHQLALGVDRVMCEGSLYDRELAALAIKQARGDMIEAIFLLRAYRTTLPRFGASESINTGAMDIRRRISATFKDLPGGQVLGPTFDYTHRLLDHTLTSDSDIAPAATAPADQATFRSVADLLAGSGLIEGQAEASGEVEVEFFAEDAGFAVPLGAIALTECQMVNQFTGSATQAPRFTRGYGISFGQNERKSMAMALVDRALRAKELGEETGSPAQDEEFVLSHSDNVQATGFVEHLKLPHYVDFQAELGLLRKLQAEFFERQAQSGTPKEAIMQDAAE